MKTYTLEQFKKFATEIEAYENGEQIEIYDSVNRVWVYQEFQNFYPNMEYRIKTKSREEITAKWVKENNLKIGDKVKVLKGFEDGLGIVKGNSDDCIGKEFIVHAICTLGIRLDSSINGWMFPVECLEKVKEEYIPFDVDDFSLFRDKWVTFKSNRNMLAKVSGFNSDHKAIYLINELVSLSAAFEELEFEDGTPFGKLKL